MIKCVYITTNGTLETMNITKKYNQYPLTVAVYLLSPGFSHLVPG